MNEIFIKKTKSGTIVSVKNGALRFDENIAENLKEIPDSLKAKARKALPGAVSISGNILFTQDEEDKIIGAIKAFLPKGLAAETTRRLATEKSNEDINYITADIVQEKSFDEVTEGQFKTYKD